MIFFTLVFISHSSLSWANLLVLSLDGFAHAYLEHVMIGPLQRLRDHGLCAKNGVKPAFTTLTFPNHWTLATGLVEESHGVISNSFYDRKRNVTFTKDTKDVKFYGGEAIWTTAKRAGLFVAVIIWPGVAALSDQFKPDKVVQYNRSITLASRLEIALEATKTHDLVMVYWDEPDRVGHAKGPWTAERVKAINHIEKHLKRVMEKLNEKNNQLNFMIVSDHGMAAIKNVTTIDIQVELKELALVLNNSTIIDALNNIVISPTSTVTHFYFTSDTFNRESLAFLFRWQVTRKSGDTEGLSQAQQALLTGTTPSTHEPIKFKGINWYLRTELPDRWFYRKSDNIGDLIAIADEGFFLELKKGDKSIYQYRGLLGSHGYDNELPSMRGILLAEGPAFKRDGAIDEIVQQTSIYPLMCHVLGIKPAPNNGSLDTFRSALEPSYSVVRVARKPSSSLSSWATSPLPPEQPGFDSASELSFTPMSSSTMNDVCFYTFLITLSLNHLAITCGVVHVK